MNIYLLITLLIVMFFLVLIIYKDIISPSSIIIMSYLVATFFASLNINEWQINFRPLTIKLVIFGIIAFVVGTMLVTMIKNKSVNDDSITIKTINVSKINVSILILFQLISLIFNFYYVQKIVGYSSFSQIGEMIGKYRMISAYSDEYIQIPFFVTQMVKISRLIFYFMFYIYFNNIFAKPNTKNYKEVVTKITIIISFLIQAFTSLLSGGRFELIGSVIGIIMMYLIFYKRFNKKSLNFTKKLKVAGGVLLILLLFSFTRNIVGRNNDSDFISYVSTYTGSGVVLLDKGLHGGFAMSDTFGYQTFYPFYRLLSKFGIVSDFRRGNLAFSTSGKLIGNVYTSLGTMYMDFGKIGVLILQFLLGIMWQLLYNKVKTKNENKFNNIFYLILYATLIDSLFLHSYSEGFYSFIFSQTFILQIIYCYVIYVFLFKTYIYFNKKNNILNK